MLEAEKKEEEDKKARLLKEQKTNDEANKQTAEGSGENSFSLKASTPSSKNKEPTQSASTTNMPFMTTSHGHTSPQYEEIDVSSLGPSKRKRKVHVKTISSLHFKVLNRKINYIARKLNRSTYNPDYDAHAMNEIRSTWAEFTSQVTGAVKNQKPIS